MWVSIANDDVLAVLNHSELSAFQQFRQATGQTDPLATLITHVTHEIHAHLRVRHTLDASGGVPTSLVGAACAIVAHRLLLRCNANPGDARRAAHDHALKLLENVARGQVGIEMPVNPSLEPTSAPAPRITPRRHRFTSATEDGL